MASTGEVTRLLRDHQAGDAEALDRLVPLVYDDLRRIARRQLAGHRRGLLDTTALVHEAYLKLADQEQIPGDSRRQLFAVVARAMRQVVVDFARRQQARKRGGGTVRISLEAVELAIEREAESLLDLDSALARLEAIDGRLVSVVECRFFAGLSETETAETLSVSARTVQRDWLKARAWLRREMAT